MVVGYPMQHEVLFFQSAHGFPLAMGEDKDRKIGWRKGRRVKMVKTKI